MKMYFFRKKKQSSHFCCLSCKHAGVLLFGSHCYQLHSHPKIDLCLKQSVTNYFFIQLLMTLLHKVHIPIFELIIVNSGIIMFICPTATTCFIYHTSHTFLVADCNQLTCPALDRSNRTCLANLDVQPCPVRSLICSVQLSSTAQHVIFLSQNTI